MNLKFVMGFLLFLSCPLLPTSSSENPANNLETNELNVCAPLQDVNIEELVNALTALVHEGVSHEELMQNITQMIIALLQATSEGDDIYIEEILNQLGNVRRKQCPDCLERTEQKKEQEETTQAILTEFAGIAGCVANIVAAPRNPRVLAPSIASMFASIIRIIVQIIKKDKEAGSPQANSSLTATTLQANINKVLAQKKGVQ